jgi:hypothetical protein
MERVKINIDKEKEKQMFTVGFQVNVVRAEMIGIVANERM